MKILSHQNINLHSASADGGLVNVPKEINREVPDDVQDHPAFDMLVDSGIIAILEPGSSATRTLNKAHEPGDPEVQDTINGSPRDVYVNAAEHRAKVLQEKQKYIEELEAKLDDANKKISELEGKLTKEEDEEPEEKE